ncbi:MAG: Surface protein, associated with type IV pili like structure [Candidatus Methanohalarchaeum thermophilum]|uniref:Surface protein, associated with type IV pili like structure n=1 Tax=Methanohalarchaeum thermophilum TaxID=1903181 RepID=A0A1Q6DUV5_METT1|nr:MAG: Surface protein, associated with type IV pili like structure [Candidatus Methanohalarchaeum thermophilum]
MGYISVIMKLLKVLDEEEKGKTLFGGKGYNKTLDWIDDDFLGFIVIKFPEKSNKRGVLVLKNNDEILAEYKNNKSHFKGNKALKEIKKLFNDDKSIIETYNTNLDKINEIIEQYPNHSVQKKELNEFSIGNLKIPKAKYITQIEDLEKLKEILEENRLTGYAKSKEENSIIVFVEGKVKGGAYKDEMGLLKRDESILDIREKSPYLVAEFMSDPPIDDLIKQIKFKSPEKFWESLKERPKEKKDAGGFGKSKIEVTSNGEPVEDAVIEFKKGGKDLGIAKTHANGRAEKKIRPGEYEITIRKKGLKEKSFKLYIEKGEKVEKRVELETKKINLGLQILTKNNYPLTAANVETLKGLKRIDRGKTNDKGVYETILPEGIYSIKIENKELEKNFKIDLKNFSGYEKKILIKFDKKNIVKESNKVNKELKDVLKEKINKYLPNK